MINPSARSRVPARRAQQRGKPQLVRHRRHRGHMPVRQRPGDGELAAGRHQRLALQGRLDRGDHLRGQLRQVGQRLVADLFAVPIGAAHQHRLVAAHIARLVHIPARCPGYMHPHWLCHNLNATRRTQLLMSPRHTEITGYTSAPKPTTTPAQPQFAYLTGRNFGLGATFSVHEGKGDTGARRNAPQHPDRFQRRTDERAL